MSDFNGTLSSEIRDASVFSGSEWLIPFSKVREAIALASQYKIAVLGVEVFRILSDRLGTEGYSGYDFKFTGSWVDFVSQNNQSADVYVGQHGFGEGYGYVLTTASEKEFSHLRDHING